MVTTERSRPARTERLEARLTREDKQILQHAADLEGQSLTEFVLRSARAAAEQTIRSRHVITLTAQESLAFAEALLAPAEPNENLRAAFARHRQLVRKQ